MGQLSIKGKIVLFLLLLLGGITFDVVGQEKSAQGRIGGGGRGFFGCSCGAKKSPSTPITEEGLPEPAGIPTPQPSKETDTDGDGIPDAKDEDDDNDGTIDANDPCPLDSTNSCQPRTGGAQCTANSGCNAGLACNTNSSACEPDGDGDGVPDGQDNCPITAGNQTDTDGDGLGDICDSDIACEMDDQCPAALVCNQAAGQCTQGLDRDGDGVTDDRDNCPDVANPNQLDLDADNLGNACDADDQSGEAVWGAEVRFSRETVGAQTPEEVDPLNELADIAMDGHFDTPSIDGLYRDQLIDLRQSGAGAVTAEVVGGPSLSRNFRVERSVASIRLVAARDPLFRNLDSTPIIAQLLDAQGQPVGPDVTVNFSATNGTVTPSSATTDRNGMITTVNVRANSNLFAAGGILTVTAQEVGGRQASLPITANEAPPLQTETGPSLCNQPGNTDPVCVWMELPTGDLLTGSEFNVPVFIKNQSGRPIDNFTVQVNFETPALSFVSIDPGEPGNPTIPNFTSTGSPNTLGFVIMTAYEQTPTGLFPTGTSQARLATIRFRATRTGTAFLEGAVNSLYGQNTSFNAVPFLTYGPPGVDDGRMTLTLRNPNPRALFGWATNPTLYDLSPVGGPTQMTDYFVRLLNEAGTMLPVSDLTTTPTADGKTRLASPSCPGCDLDLSPVTIPATALEIGVDLQEFRRLANLPGEARYQESPYRVFARFQDQSEIDASNLIPLVSSNPEVLFIDPTRRLARGLSVGSAVLSAGNAAPITVNVTDTTIAIDRLHLVVPASLSFNLQNRFGEGESSENLGASVRSVFTTIPQSRQVRVLALTANPNDPPTDVSDLVTSGDIEILPDQAGIVSLEGLTLTSQGPTANPDGSPLPGFENGLNLQTRLREGQTPNDPSTRIDVIPPDGEIIVRRCVDGCGGTNDQTISGNIKLALSQNDISNDLRNYNEEEEYQIFTRFEGGEPTLIMENASLLENNNPVLVESEFDEGDLRLSSSGLQPGQVQLRIGPVMGLSRTVNVDVVSLDRFEARTTAPYPESNTAPEKRILRQIENDTGFSQWVRLWADAILTDGERIDLFPFRDHGDFSFTVNGAAEFNPYNRWFIRNVGMEEGTATITIDHDNHEPLTLTDYLTVTNTPADIRSLEIDSRDFGPGSNGQPTTDRTVSTLIRDNGSTESKNFRVVATYEDATQAMLIRDDDQTIEVPSLLMLNSTGLFLVDEKYDSYEGEFRIGSILDLAQVGGSAQLFVQRNGGALVEAWVNPDFAIGEERGQLRLAANLLPDLGDVDLGELNGVPFPDRAAGSGTFVIPVRMNVGTNQLGNFQLQLFFDNDVLKLPDYSNVTASIRPGSGLLIPGTEILNGYAFAPTAHEQAPGGEAGIGRINIMVFNNGTGAATGTIEVARLTLEPKKTTQHVTPITGKLLSLQTRNGVNIGTFPPGGRGRDILAGDGDLDPPPPGLRGDLSDNNVFSSEDIQLIQNALIQRTEASLLLYDADHFPDGRVDSNDTSIGAKITGDFTYHLDASATYPFEANGGRIRLEARLTDKNEVPVTASQVEAFFDLSASSGLTGLPSGSGEVATTTTGDGLFTATVSGILGTGNLRARLLLKGKDTNGNTIWQENYLGGNPILDIPVTSDGRGACISDDQCAAGMDCLENVCIASCSAPGACPAGQRCDVDDGICRDIGGSCGNDDACVDQFCIAGTCVEPGEGCRLNTHCDAGEICLAGSCTLGTSGGTCDPASETGCGGNEMCNAEGFCVPRDLSCLPACSEGMTCDPTTGDCQADPDGDGVFDDNCPTEANADQIDSDGDGTGDACDESPIDPLYAVEGATVVIQPTVDSPGQGSKMITETVENDGAYSSLIHSLLKPVTDGSILGQALVGTEVQSEDAHSFEIRAGPANKIFLAVNKARLFPATKPEVDLDPAVEAYAMVTDARGNPLSSGQIRFKLNGNLIQIVEIPADGIAHATIPIPVTLFGAGPSDTTATINASSLLLPSSSSRTVNLAPQPSSFTRSPGLIWIEIPNREMVVGESFTAIIRANLPGALAGYSFDLNYDGTQLNATSALVPSTVTGVPVIENAAPHTDDHVSFSTFVAGDDGPSGIIELGRITFSVTAVGDGTASFSIASPNIGYRGGTITSGDATRVWDGDLAEPTSTGELRIIAERAEGAFLSANQQQLLDRSPLFGDAGHASTTLQVRRVMNRTLNPLETTPVVFTPSMGLIVSIDGSSFVINGTGMILSTATSGSNAVSLKRGTLTVSNRIMLTNLLLSSVELQLSDETLQPIATTLRPFNGTQSAELKVIGTFNPGTVKMDISSEIPDSRISLANCRNPDTGAVYPAAACPFSLSGRRFSASAGPLISDATADIVLLSATPTLPQTGQREIHYSSGTGVDLSSNPLRIIIPAYTTLSTLEPESVDSTNTTETNGMNAHAFVASLFTRVGQSTKPQVIAPLTDDSWLDVTSSAKWTSGNESIVSVCPIGRTFCVSDQRCCVDCGALLGGDCSTAGETLTARGNGTTTITAQFAGASGTANVRVDYAQPSQVQIWLQRTAGEPYELSTPSVLVALQNDDITRILRNLPDEIPYKIVGRMGEIGCTVAADGTVGPSSSDCLDLTDQASWSFTGGEDVASFSGSQIASRTTIEQGRDGAGTGQYSLAVSLWPGLATPLNVQVVTYDSITLRSLETYTPDEEDPNSETILSKIEENGTEFQQANLSVLVRFTDGPALIEASQLIEDDRGSSTGATVLLVSETDLQGQNISDLTDSNLQGLVEIGAIHDFAPFNRMKVAQPTSDDFSLVAVIGTISSPPLNLTISETAVDLQQLKVDWKRTCQQNRSGDFYPLTLGTEVNCNGNPNQPTFRVRKTPPTAINLTSYATFADDSEGARTLLTESGMSQYEGLVSFSQNNLNGEPTNFAGMARGDVLTISSFGAANGRVRSRENGLTDLLLSPATGIDGDGSAALLDGHNRLPLNILPGDLDIDLGKDFDDSYSYDTTLAFDLPIRINASQEVGTVELELFYNPMILVVPATNADCSGTITSSVSGTTLSCEYWQPGATGNPAPAGLAAIHINEVFDPIHPLSGGILEIARLRFNAKVRPEGTHTWSPIRGRVRVMGPAPAVADLTGGFVSIVAAVGEIDPHVHFGDVTGDGWEINSADVLYTLYADATNLDVGSNLPYFDCHRDGLVNWRDARCLNFMTVGAVHFITGEVDESNHETLVEQPIVRYPLNGTDPSKAQFAVQLWSRERNGEGDQQHPDPARTTVHFEVPQNQLEHMTFRTPSATGPTDPPLAAETLGEVSRVQAVHQGNGIYKVDLDLIGAGTDIPVAVILETWTADHRRIRTTAFRSSPSVEEGTSLEGVVTFTYSGAAPHCTTDTECAEFYTDASATCDQTSGLCTGGSCLNSSTCGAGGFCLTNPATGGGTCTFPEACHPTDDPICPSGTICRSLAGLPGLTATRYGCLPTDRPILCNQNRECLIGDSCDLTTGRCSDCGDGQMRDPSDPDSSCSSCAEIDPNLCEETCDPGEIFDFTANSCRPYDCSESDLAGSDPFDPLDPEFNLNSFDEASATEIASLLAHTQNRRLFFVAPNGTDGTDDDPATFTIGRPGQTIKAAVQRIKKWQEWYCCEGDRPASGPEAGWHCADLMEKEECTEHLAEGDLFRLFVHQSGDQPYQESNLALPAYTALGGGYKFLTNDGKFCLSRATGERGYNTKVRNTDPSKSVFKITPSTMGPGEVRNRSFIEGFFITNEFEEGREKSYAIFIQDASPTITNNRIIGQRTPIRMMSSETAGTDSSGSYMESSGSYSMQDNDDLAQQATINSLSDNPYASAATEQSGTVEPDVVAGIYIKGHSSPVIRDNEIRGYYERTSAPTGYLLVDFKPTESDGVRFLADNGITLIYDWPGHVSEWIIHSPTIVGNTIYGGTANTRSYDIRARYCEMGRSGLHVEENMLNGGEATYNWNFSIVGGLTDANEPAECPAPYENATSETVQAHQGKIIVDRNKMKCNDSEIDYCYGVSWNGEELPDHSDVEEYRIVSNNLITASGVDHCYGIYYSGGKLDVIQNTVDTSSCTGSSDSPALYSHVRLSGSPANDNHLLIDFPKTVNNFLIGKGCAIGHRILIGYTSVTMTTYNYFDPSRDINYLSSVRYNMVWPGTIAWDRNCLDASRDTTAINYPMNSVYERTSGTGETEYDLTDYFVLYPLNYHLKPDTLAVNHGSNYTDNFKLVLSPEDPDHVHDRDGNERPVGTGLEPYDRGAYEYIPPAAPPAPPRR